MPQKHSKCGLSVLSKLKHLSFGIHKKRAALVKIIKVKLLVHHFSCLLCDLLIRSISLQKVKVNIFSYCLIKYLYINPFW